MIPTKFVNVTYGNQTFTVHPDKQLHDNMGSCVNDPDCITPIKDQPARQCNRHGETWVILDPQRKTIHACGTTPYACEETLDWIEGTRLDPTGESFTVWYSSQKQYDTLTRNYGEQIHDEIHQALLHPVDITVIEDGTWVYHALNGVTVNVNQDMQRVDEVKVPESWTGGASEQEIAELKTRNMNLSLIRNAIEAINSRLSDDQVLRIVNIVNSEWK